MAFSTDHAEATQTPVGVRVGSKGRAAYVDVSLPWSRRKATRHLYRSAMAHMDHFLWTYPLGIPAKFLSVISCRTGIEFSSYPDLAVGALASSPQAPL